MAKGYTKTEIIEKIKEEAKNISEFYKADFINYSGRTTDTSELYTEIVAEWLLQHLNVLGQITKIKREKGYFTKTHNGQTAAATSNRVEERIAMALFRRKNFNSIGEIIDYQTPLKNELSDTAGKIDLLSYDGKIVRILELKKPDCAEFVGGQIVLQPALKSKEHPESMLRCVLEGYTYLQTIDDKTFFFNSFEQIRPNATNATLMTSPLVFMGSTQWAQMNNSEYKFLHKLMKALDIQPFYVTGNCEANFDIIQ